MPETPFDASADEGAIAVVGISLRFPGAPDVRRFWTNLAAGVDSVTVLDSEQRARAGMPSGEGWVAAAGLIESPEQFDAAFFGYSPREAEQLDPQHRLFLECAHEGLESAGYAVRSQPLHAGVYAGAALSTYLLENVLPNLERRSSDLTESVLGTNPDFLATRVAYKLNLTGPALTVQTACSTSLTAIHLACQALLAGECNLALAGGAAVSTPQLVAYRAGAGSISSPDGRCRAFDEKAAGTVPGNGVGVVVLKRLADALADGDPIRAVIRGTAIANDGANKAGFIAPSVSGQVAAITSAQALAGVEPRSISYIEAHGTGTPLGEPVEVAALKQVFRGVAPGSVGLGSVKTNIGYLGAAAGMSGFIKAVLALEHKLLPPTVHFQRPNPLLELEGSPFYVIAQPRPWTGPLPRRAGVSAFGMGGTNAHAVLEEAPPSPATDPSRRDEELLLLSARSEEALERMSAELAEHLGRATEPLADVAHTLQVGRTRFGWRRFVIASRKDGAATLLTGTGGQRPRTALDEAERRGAVFLFPGTGAPRVNLAVELLKERGFREAIDSCADLVRRHLGSDPREVMFAGPERFDAASRELSRPLWTQPALFTFEWALTRLWRSWGVEPEALLGHSLGEYVAACLAGVFTLEEALELVVARGRILEQLPAGDPTAVLESHLADFARVVSRCSPRAPSVPVVSSLTGRWLTGREAADPAYWCRHLRETAGLSDALGLLLSSGERALIEVGPGTALTSLARQHPARTSQPLIATLPETSSRPGRLLAPLGEAWLAGVPIDWEHFRAGERRRRVTLPTYSFDRQRYWIDAPSASVRAPTFQAPPALPGGLVEFQAGTRGTPIFLVYPASGQVLPYRALARAISSERPVYGLEAVGLSEGGQGHTTVEELATHSLEFIRKVQPDGPYLLVGASLGGLVIYELARRLTAEGQSVPLCAMLDTPAPGSGAAQHRYVPPRWEGGELQYFRAMEPAPGEPPHPEVGWLHLGAAVRVEVVSGDALGARLARLLR